MLTSDSNVCNTESHKIKQQEIKQVAGYYGYSKSNNAINAEDEGKYPLTIAAKIGAKSTGLPISKVKKILEANWNGEWHHTSKYFNRTNYYNVSPLMAIQGSQRPKKSLLQSIYDKACASLLDEPIEDIYDQGHITTPHDMVVLYHAQKRKEERRFEEERRKALIEEWERARQEKYEKEQRILSDLKVETLDKAKLTELIKQRIFSGFSRGGTKIIRQITKYTHAEINHNFLGTMGKRTLGCV